MAQTRAQRRENDAAPAEGGKRKGKGKLLLLVLLILVLLGGGGAAAYVFVLKGHVRSTVHHGPPPPGPTFTLPQLTTNLDDGHIVQVTMVLELASGDTTAEVSHDLNALNNAAILTFGQVGYSSLLPTQGRVQAASELESAFNQVLGAGPAPHDRVVGIEFTSFIVQ
jgi:flagellar FliL protein